MASSVSPPSKAHMRNASMASNAAKNELEGVGGTGTPVKANYRTTGGRGSGVGSSSSASPSRKPSTSSTTTGAAALENTLATKTGSGAVVGTTTASTSSLTPSRSKNAPYANAEDKAPPPPAVEGSTSKSSTSSSSSSRKSSPCDAPDEVSPARLRVLQARLSKLSKEQSASRGGGGRDFSGRKNSNSVGNTKSAVSNSASVSEQVEEAAVVKMNKKSSTEGGGEIRKGDGGDHGTIANTTRKEGEQSSAKTSSSTGTSPTKAIEQSAKTTSTEHQSSSSSSSAPSKRRPSNQSSAASTSTSSTSPNKHLQLQHGAQQDQQNAASDPTEPSQPDDFVYVNRFPQMYHITRKDLLARNLQGLRKSLPDDYNFFPPTYCLSTDRRDLTKYLAARLLPAGQRVQQGDFCVDHPHQGGTSSESGLSKTVEKLSIRSAGLSNPNLLGPQAGAGSPNKEREVGSLTSSPTKAAAEDAGSNAGSPTKEGALEQLEDEAAAKGSGMWFRGLMGGRYSQERARQRLMKSNPDLAAVLGSPLSALDDAPPWLAAKTPGGKDEDLDSFNGGGGDVDGERRMIMTPGGTRIPREDADNSPLALLKKNVLAGSSDSAQEATDKKSQRCTFILKPVDAAKGNGIRLLQISQDAFRQGVWLEDILKKVESIIVAPPTINRGMTEQQFYQWMHDQGVVVDRSTNTIMHPGLHSERTLAQHRLMNSGKKNASTTPGTSNSNLSGSTGTGGANDDHCGSTAGGRSPAKMPDTVVPGQKCNRFLLQRYITAPATMEEGVKWDCRVYVLITATRPELKAYLFDEGFARLCTQGYSKPRPRNLDTFQKHLTNFSINWKDDNFDDTGEPHTGSKRSLKCVLEQISRTYCIPVARLWLPIADVVAKTLLAVAPKLDVANRRYFPKNVRSFQLLGFDVMFHSDFSKCWLLEVNHDPSLSVLTYIDRVIKGKLISQIFQLVGAVEGEPERLAEPGTLKTHEEVPSDQTSATSPSKPILTGAGPSSQVSRSSSDEEGSDQKKLSCRSRPGLLSRDSEDEYTKRREAAKRRKHKGNTKQKMLQVYRQMWEQSNNSESEYSEYEDETSEKGVNRRGKKHSHKGLLTENITKFYATANFMYLLPITEEMHGPQCYGKAQQIRQLATQHASKWLEFSAEHLYDNEAASPQK
ncbi:unnamed protein product [Amoebophrya sp. A25]|nr:unnamed protein product [Amoebophrya sp. A25]|eukprot:GSA25T00017993001.1